MLQQMAQRVAGASALLLLLLLSFSAAKAAAAAATTTTNATTNATTALCRWDNSTGDCDVSPAFMLTTLTAGLDASNAFSADLLQAYAIEMRCNSAGSNNSSCAASPGCIFSATEVGCFWGRGA